MHVGFLKRSIEEPKRGGEAGILVSIEKTTINSTKNHLSLKNMRRAEKRMQGF